jgi:hypothetical protein
VLRPEHEIFEKPFAVGFHVERTPTPDNFKKWSTTVGDTVPTFKVFDTFDEKHDESGLVTSDSGFEEFPDAERILGGINHKGPEYAAIARHGSFVMFGFHALPERFTDEGRKLYLNTLAYAVAHKDAPVETLRLRPVRTDLLEALTTFMVLYPESEHMRVAERAYAGEPIPPEILKDPASAKKWYAERAPYLHPADDGSNWSTSYQLATDTQCKELGLANDSLAFLDALALRLGKDAHDPVATALLARYVPDVEPARLGAWLAENRDKLYFTESGGWVWRVKGTRVQSPVLRNRTAAIADDPVRVQAETSGTTLTIVLRVREGWHVYSPKTTEGKPVSIAVAEGSAFEVTGPAVFVDDENGTLSGYVQVKVPIRRIAPGGALLVDVTYTVCDAKSCRPPRTVRLSR